jgi:glycosyltransferase XagB
LGATLFEGDAAAIAGTRAVEDHYTLSADETFARRLAEARAFGLASEGLASVSPELSAKTGLSLAQRAGGWSLTGTLAYFTVMSPQTVGALLVGTLGVIFSLLIAMRLCAAIGGSFARAPRRAPQIPDDDLPALSILVPIYREERVVAALVEAISRLDYPTDKLDVKLLVEADDLPTLRAIEALNLPMCFEVIPVPPGAPRTKPKALNYGLNFARGEFVAVFDAEDHPSPDQARAAIAAFRSGPANLAVVQAPLLIHNGDDAWFASQFEVEYAIHFRVWLPFLARLHVPLALGGTSNYFRRDMLTTAGGWDAWNVTEDADIGLRFARFGGAAAMIDPPTYEEAPAKLSGWMKQRTRWMKGHLQTWLVLMRQPISAARGMGLANFLSVQLTLGGSILASIVHAPIFLWLAAGAFTPFVSLEGWHAALFGVGYGSVLVAAIVARPPRIRLWTLLTLPLYWPLLSIAMLMALVDIKRRPHFWAKTAHGTRPSRSVRTPG